MRLRRREDRSRRRRLRVLRRFRGGRRHRRHFGLRGLLLSVLGETVSILEAEADVVEHGELLVVAEIEAGDHAVVRDGEKGEILARVHLDS